MRNITTKIAKKEDALSIYNVKFISRKSLYTKLSTDLKESDFLTNSLDKARNVKKIRQLLQTTNRRFFVAIESGEIVGFIYVKKVGKLGRIKELFILPKYQVQGLGKLLMGKGLAWLSDMDEIKLQVVKSNLPAINLYKKYGFTESKEVSVPYTINNTVIKRIVMNRPKR